MRRLALALLLAAGCARYDDSENLLPKLSGEPRAVLEKVEWGDRHYARATYLLKHSSPSATSELKEAAELFMKANQEGYLAAQELYGRQTLPQPLLDQIRECTMRASLCRKHAFQRD